MAIKVTGGNGDQVLTVATVPGLDGLAPEVRARSPRALEARWPLRAGVSETLDARVLDGSVIEVHDGRTTWRFEARAGAWTVARSDWPS